MGFQDEVQAEVEKLQTEQVESDTTEKTEEAPVESEEVTPEEQPKEVKSEEVPASFQKRIDELTYRYKSEREAKTKLEEQLKSQRQNPAQPTTEEEKREQSAREYLAKLVDERLTAIKSKEEQADKALQDEMDHVSALYPNFNKDKVLKVMEKYGIDNVEKAHLASLEMTREVEKAKEETKKDILAKPKSPSSIKTQDGFATKFSDENIANKSIWELSEMAKKEAGL